MKYLSVLLAGFIMVSGFASAAGFFETIKKIRYAGYEIKATKIVIAKEFIKEKEVLNQNIEYHSRKRIEYIKDLLPFFKNKEGLAVVDEISESPDLWSMKECIDILSEQLFNERFADRETVLKKLNELKNRIESEPADEVRDWSSDYSKAFEYYNKRDYANAIIYFKRALPGLEAEISAGTNLPPYVISAMKMQAVMGYWSLGVSYEFLTPPKEQYYYNEARTAFFDSLNKYPLALPTLISSVYTCICRTYYFERNWDKAIEYLNLAAQTTQTYTGKPMKYYDLCLAEIQMGQSAANYDKALVVINKEIANFTLSDEYLPQNGEVMHYNRAVIYASKGMIKEARADIEKVNTYYNMAHFANEAPIAKDERELYKRRAEALKAELDNYIDLQVFPQTIAMASGSFSPLFALAKDANGNQTGTISFTSANPAIVLIKEQESADGFGAAFLHGLDTGETVITVTAVVNNKTKEKIVPVKVSPYTKESRQGKRFYRTSSGGADPFTGNFSISRNDYSIRGSLLGFGRTYNSLMADSTTEITIGNKWTFNYNIRLELYELSTNYVIKLVDNTGAVYLYGRSAKNANLYYNLEHPDYPLIVYASNQYQMLSRSGDILKFNTNGRIVEFATLQKETLKFEYINQNINGNREVLSKVTDNTGRTAAFTYNKDKRIDTVAFSTGMTLRYSYDSKGNLVAAILPMDITEKYEYNAKNQLVRIISPENTAETVEYLNDGRFLAASDSESGRQNFSYGKKKTTIKDKNGNSSILEFTPVGSLKGFTAPDNSIATFEWNSNNDLVSFKEPLGGTKAFTYDDRHNLTSGKDALGNTVNMKYDARFRALTEITDALQRKTSFTYDSTKRMLEGISPLKDKTVFKYENQSFYGKPTSAVESDAVETVTKYDKYGYPAEVSRKKNDTVVTLKYVHSANGLLQSVTDMAGAVTKYEYDALERVIKVINPDNSERLYTYDKKSNLLSVTDELKNRTEYGYDKVGRLVSVTLPDKAKTTYSYDKAGNLTRVTKADGSYLSYLYDNMNRVIKITDEAGKITLFSYDKNGNLIKKQNLKGNYIVFVYDVLNRITKKIYYKWQDSPEYTINYTYDAAGNLVNIKSENTDITYTYNELNQITKESNKNILESVFTYNSKGAILSEVSAYLNKAFTYDEINRLSEMKANGLSYKYTYDTTGRLSEFSQNGVLSKYTYDISSRVTSKTTEMNKAIIEKFDYKYDAAGKRIYEKEESDKNSNTYAFDAVGRLAKATYEDGNFEEFGYNLLGERISKKTLTDTEEIYVYDTNGQLTGTASIKKRSFTYDANGNISGKTVSKMIDNRMVVENTRYEFNSRDLLARIVLPDNKTIEYDYDALGRRISIKYDGKTRRIVYSGNNKVAEFNEDKKTQYVYGSGADQILSLTRDGKNYHFLRGTANSSGKIIDSAGATQKEYRYRAFGEIYGQTGEFVNDITFTSRELDEIAGIYYYRARFYDPEIGRFLSRDPHPASISNPYDFNKYMYCGNDPINFTDPMGLYDLYDLFSDQASSGYQKDTFIGNMQGLFFSGAETLLDTIGGKLVKETSILSGTAAGEGRMAAAFGWGITSSTLIAVNAASFGRIGQMLGGTAGKKGILDFSHSIPSRLGGPREWWNGAMVNPKIHALMDPYRYLKGMTKADKWPSWRRLINRLPSWAQGIVGIGSRETVEITAENASLDE